MKDLTCRTGPVGSGGPRRNFRSVNGFTLAEVMMTVAILGLTASIAGPRLNLSRLRSKAAIQSVGTTLLALQRAAIAAQHDIVVMVDVPGRALRILDDSTNDLTINHGERVRVVPLGDEIVLGRPSAVTPRDFGSAPVSFTTTERSTGLPAIVFYRNGSAREYGGFYVSTVLAMRGAPGHDSETWAMSISRASGRAEWVRWNGTAWVRGF